MKVSCALAEIVSEFSGFQHLHTSTSNSSLSSTSSVSRKSSTTSSESMQRHSLNITIGATPVNQIARNDSSNSLNDYKTLQRKNSSASYLVIE